MAIAGISDGRLQCLVYPQSAIALEDQHVGLERSRDAGGQQAGAGDNIETEMTAVMGDGCSRGRRPLTAHNLRLALFLLEENCRNVAAGTVEVRFDDLQGKGGSNTGIECVPALFQ